MATPAQTILYPVSRDEAQCFGWDDDNVIVMAIRGPDGRRVIPTRQQMSDGNYHYGTIETYEPPAHLDEDTYNEVYAAEHAQPSCPLM